MKIPTIIAAIILQSITIGVLYWLWDLGEPATLDNIREIILGITFFFTGTWILKTLSKEGL